MKRGLSGKAALMIAACSAAFSAPLNKIALFEGIHPVWLNALRLGIALLLMLLYRPSRGGEAKTHAKPSPLTILSGVFLAAHLLFWVFALKETDALAATTIWSTYLFMAAAGSVLLLRERMSPVILGPMLLAFIGVVVCNRGWSGSELTGNLYALGAAVTYAAYLLCGRRARQSMDTYQYTRIVYAVALICQLLFAAALRLPPEGFTLISVSSGFGLALFSTLLGHTMCNYALKTISATTVSTVMLTEVITGPLLVFALLGERPGQNTLIGGLIILLAVSWYLIMERRGKAA